MPCMGQGWVSVGAWQCSVSANALSLLRLWLYPQLTGCDEPKPRPLNLQSSVCTRCLLAACGICRGRWSCGDASHLRRPLAQHRPRRAPILRQGGGGCSRQWRHRLRVLLFARFWGSPDGDHGYRCHLPVGHRGHRRDDRCGASEGAWRRRRSRRCCGVIVCSSSGGSGHGCSDDWS